MYDISCLTTLEPPHDVEIRDSHPIELVEKTQNSMIHKLEYYWGLPLGGIDLETSLNTLRIAKDIEYKLYDMVLAILPSRSTIEKMVEFFRLNVELPICKRRLFTDIFSDLCFEYNCYPLEFKDPLYIRHPDGSSSRFDYPYHDLPALKSSCHPFFAAELSWTGVLLHRNSIPANIQPSVMFLAAMTAGAIPYDFDYGRSISSYLYHQPLPSASGLDLMQPRKRKLAPPSNSGSTDEEEENCTVQNVRKVLRWRETCETYREVPEPRVSLVKKRLRPRKNELLKRNTRERACPVWRP